MDKAERTRDFERFLTFIDAIVAIAITLLVLPLVDLTAELDGGSVADLLRHHQVEIGGFLLSFMVIASSWGAQHRAVRTVIAASPMITRLMMLWTLTIVILPFPTALVAASGHQPTTKIFYIGMMTLTSAVLTALCWTIGRNRAVRDSDETPDTLKALGSTLGFAAALAISLIFPQASYYPLLLLLLSSRLIDLWRVWRRRRTPEQSAG
jgi:uncharacterized membrane protein